VVPPCSDGPRTRDAPGTAAKRDRTNSSRSRSPARSWSTARTLVAEPLWDHVVLVAADMNPLLPATGPRRCGVNWPRGTVRRLTPGYGPVGCLPPSVARCGT
jgi:hypothetical protein